MDACLPKPQGRCLQIRMVWKKISGIAGRFYDQPKTLFPPPPEARPATAGLFP